MITEVLEDLRTDPSVAARLQPHRAGAGVHALQMQSPWPGRSVWLLFAGRRPVPAAVVKVDLDVRLHARLRNEHGALSALHRRPELRSSVPEPMALRNLGSALVLAQSGLPGVALSIRARHRDRPSPRAGAREHAAVLRWLHTLQTVPAPGAVRIDAEDVLRRLRDLTGDGNGGRGLERRLTGTAASWDGLEVPLVPGHGDLTAANTVLHRGRVGVFDWEGGLGERPATADVVVFCNSYARRQQSGGLLPTRDEAFAAAFAADGWLGALTRRTFLAHLAFHGLPAEAAEAVFVATLADLASGRSGAAHAQLSRSTWRSNLRCYARLHRESVLAVQL